MHVIGPRPVACLCSSSCDPRRRGARLTTVVLNRRTASSRPRAFYARTLSTVGSFSFPINRGCLTAPRPEYDCARFTSTWTRSPGGYSVANNKPKGQALADDLRRDNVLEAIERAMEAIEQLLEVRPVQGAPPLERASCDFLRGVSEMLIRLTYLLQTDKQETQWAPIGIMVGRARSVQALDNETLKAIRAGVKDKATPAQALASARALHQRVSEMVARTPWKPPRDLPQAFSFYTGNRWDWKDDVRKMRRRPRRRPGARFSEVGPK
jgi:hypothetical protein